MFNYYCHNGNIFLIGEVEEEHCRKNNQTLGHVREKALFSSILPPAIFSMQLRNTFESWSISFLIFCYKRGKEFDQNPVTKKKPY